MTQKQPVMTPRFLMKNVYLECNTILYHLIINTSNICNYIGTLVHKYNDQLVVTVSTSV